MKIKALTITLVTLLSFSTTAKDYVVSKQACASVDEKIEAIERKMKQGYSARQGEYYKSQLRTLKNQRYDCKKKRYTK